MRVYLIRAETRIVICARLRKGVEDERNISRDGQATPATWHASRLIDPLYRSSLVYYNIPCTTRRVVIATVARLLRIWDPSGQSERTCRKSEAVRTRDLFRRFQPVHGSRR